MSFTRRREDTNKRGQAVEGLNQSEWECGIGLAGFVWIRVIRGHASACSGGAFWFTLFVPDSGV